MSLERKDFYAIADKSFDDLANRGSKPARGFSIRMTSGTSSGAPLVLVWESTYTSQQVNRRAQRFLLHHGLLTLRLGNVLQVRSGDVSDARVLTLDPAEVSPEVCALVADFAPDRGYSFPTLMMQTGPQLDEATRKGIALLSFSGECITALHSNFFAQWFPHTRLSPVYIANDTGAISGPDCGHLAYNHYHPKDGVVVEIEHVDADGVGDIVLTTRITQHAKVERYHNGDVARWVSEPCPCGNPRTFEVLGRRGYDYIKLGRALLRQEEFDRAAALCKDMYDDYRVEASMVPTDSGVVGNIVLRVYRASGPGSAADAAAIAARVSDTVFVSPSKTLADFVHTGQLVPLVVAWVAEPFPAGIKNVKLKHVSQ